MTTRDRATPKIEPKLGGQHNYAQWILSIEQTLSLYEHGDTTIWEIVTGEVTDPSGGSTIKAEKAGNKDLIKWRRDNNFAILTMKRNCEPEAVDLIGLARSAHEAYKELKAKYEGKTVTDLGAIIANVIRLVFDDRKGTIEDHVGEFEKRWGFMRATLSAGFTDKTKEFGEALQKLAWSDQAKAEFLLISLPPFYSNLVENLRAKEGYTYGDVSRQIKLYVPGRQRQGNRKSEGSQENPVVLKTDKKGAAKDNGKRCDYCIGKGWKGLNHVESECYTKKRDDKKKGKTNKTKAENEAPEDEEGSICHITIKRAGEHICEKQGKFQYDTATSHHTTNKKGLLQDIKKVHIPVRAHDGSISICDTMGTLVIKHNNQTISHEDCLYDPSYSNLISGQRMGSHKMLVDNYKGILQRKNGVEYKLEIDERGGMWITPDDSHVEIRELQAIAQQQVEQEEARELHERYGHISYNTLRTLPEFPKNIKKGMEPRCEPCEKGKTTKPPAKDHQKEGIRTSRPLERLHADLVGPIRPITPSTQYRYLLVVTDDYSRYVTTTPIKTKDETGEKLIHTINALEKATIHHVSQIQADWGGEFRNKELSAELRQRGISLKETVPRHSETNAVAERMNRTILTMSRTAIIAAENLPKSLWDKASAWAAYTKNRLPHKSLPDQKTPAEILLDRDPIKARSNLRPFGQKVICYDYEISASDKLAPRSWEGRLVGYTTTFGTYQVMNHTGGIKIVKNPIPVKRGTHLESESESEEESPMSQGEIDHQNDEQLTTPNPGVSTTEPPPAPKKKRRTATEWEKIVGSRFSMREKKPSSRIQAVGADSDHPTDEQARTSPNATKWAEARRKERSQLEKYGVFTKVNKDSIPEGTKIVDTKWVYVIKRKNDGTIEKFKARKVGRGFTQIEGVNFDETYAQMMRPETLKILLIVALYREWEVRQWDVIAAYLQAQLHHDVYISDINEEGEVEYWKLNKALYGLKQAGHEWYKTLERILNIAGLKQCTGDEGTYAAPQGHPIVGTHVDDLIGIAPSTKDLDRLEQSIEDTVELDKRGKPRKMLGMEITWKKNCAILTQTSLIESMMNTHFPNKKTVPAHGKGSSLPLDKKYYQQGEPGGTDQKNYQSIVGGLLFIARMTRPEISIQVNLLGRRAARPSPTNLQAALQTLTYLYSTRQEGIILKKPANLDLRIYADAKYGGEKARSQTGVLITLGEQPIGWYSRRQDIVSLSVTEAEYIAACEGAKDAAWGRQFLKEINVTTRTPVITTDSEGAFNLTQTNKYLRRSRHIDHRYHYIRQQSKQGLIRITTIPGKENPADIFTKVLPMSVVREWKKRWLGDSNPDGMKD